MLRMIGRPEQRGLFEECQRWRDRRPSYRPAGEPFDPNRYEARPIEFATAKAYVVKAHYSGSMPAARQQIGLYEKASPFQSDKLVGAIVLSVPIQEQAIPAWLDGLDPRLGVEIGRLVLDDHVPGNGETWFLGKTFKLMRTLLPEVRGVISYSDPIERRTASGEVVKRGHVGTVYRAFNGRYVGRSSARTLIVARDGRTVSERALSKIRLEEQGAGYAIRQLQELGAPARHPGESGKDYLQRALADGQFHRVRHPGNLTFAWNVG